MAPSPSPSPTPTGRPAPSATTSAGKSASPSLDEGPRVAIAPSGVPPHEVERKLAHGPRQRPVSCAHALDMRVRSDADDHRSSQVRVRRGSEQARNPPSQNSCTGPSHALSIRGRKVRRTTPAGRRGSPRPSRRRPSSAPVVREGRAIGRPTVRRHLQRGGEARAVPVDLIGDLLTDVPSPGRSLGGSRWYMHAATHSCRSLSKA